MKNQIKGIVTKKINYSNLLNSIFIYRYDIFSIVFMYLIIIWFMSSLFLKGNIVFSDIDIPFDSRRYMEEIFGLWNGRWSSPSMLNLPRLFYASIPYGISAIFGFSGEVFFKSLLLIILFTSSTTIYLFGKRLVSIYISKEFNFFKVLALISGGLFYALNPWVVFRIQHIYLLCGYSLFPLVLMLFFNIFDPKFQKQLIKDYYIFNPNLYRKNVIDIITLAITFAFLSGGIHYFFYSAIYLPILAFLLIVKNILVYKKYGAKKINYFLLNFFKKFLLFILFFLIFNFFWFGMYFGSILLHSSPSQHNINVVDTLSMFSRHSSLKNVLYMISYWWPMFDISRLSLSFYFGGGVLLTIILYAMVMRSHKYNIVLMFSFLSIIFVILATGVELNAVADTFIKVTKLPIIGSMFRDPNKLVGINALNFSILLIFGLELIFSKISNNMYGWSFELFIIIFIIFSLYIYIEPLKKNFLDGFYSPIKRPQEYELLNNKMKEESFNRAIYMPVADNMTQSYTGVATPYWNLNGNEDGFLKATGDIQVYNSSVNTVFHHEGNMIGIPYMYNFMQYLMDTGRSINLNTYIGRFSADTLIYANQYLGMGEKQQFNMDMISLQKNMKKIYENNIFSVYKQEKNYKKLNIFEKKLITPYGYGHFESLNSNDSFDYKKIAILPSAIEHKGFSSYVDTGDFIEVSNKEDLMFSDLSDEYLIKPFEFINDGSVFLKWSKTFVKDSEWFWFLQSQDIENYPFDFDYFDGVAVTFASAKLDVLPYKMKLTKGSLIADFDSLLREEKFFTPDNPDLFVIQSNPIGEGNIFSEVSGEIVKGNPKNIWQVAKSGLIEIKENNPYKFNIKMSGRGTNKIHFKARFFDNDMKELGISYVVAPGEQINFNSINFFGEFVTPKDAKFVRLDILSFQRPTQKSYWWIHDMELFDLEKYKAKNTFTMEKEIKEDNEYELYTRVFKSIKGGIVKFSVNGKDVLIDTKSKNVNSFIWEKIGTFNLKKGKSLINAENISGFNAINLVAIIPTEKKEKLFYQTNKAIEKSKVFFISEAENDFDIHGNIQTKRNFPILSYGKGISLQNGYIEKSFDVLKSSNYSFNINLYSDSLKDNSITFKIIDSTNKDIFEKKIELKKIDKINLKTNFIAEYEEGRDHDRSLKKIPNILNNKFSININNINLTQGNYKILVQYNSLVETLSSFDDIHKFNPNEITVDETTDELEVKNNVSCEKIYPYMMRNHVKDKILVLDYDSTCSTDWYVYASKKIPVEKENEYIVQFDAQSLWVKDRHAKIIFLDSDNRVVSVTYINEVPESDKDKWHHYEQIVRTPKNSSKMLLQFLTHGDKEKIGILNIKNYSILPYKELILIDNVGVFEGKTADKFFNTNDNNYSVQVNKYDNMKTSFKIDNNNSLKKIMGFAESPSPMWNLATERQFKRNEIYLNSITSGYLITNDTEGTFEINLRKAYYFGLLLVIISPILCILILRRFKI